MHETQGSMAVLVTGGTGTLGRHVVPRLQAAGWSVRVLTRHSRPDHDGVHYVTGDLLSGEGIKSAVEGVASIVHCAGTGRGDVTMTQNLVRAVAAQAGFGVAAPPIEGLLVDLAVNDGVGLVGVLICLRR